MSTGTSTLVDVCTPLYENKDIEQRNNDSKTSLNP